MNSENNNQADGSFRVRGDAYYTNAKGELVHLGIVNQDIVPTVNSEESKQPIVFTKADARFYIQMTPDCLRKFGLLDGFAESEFDEAEKVLSVE